MHGIICCKFMHCSPWRCYSFLYGMYCVLGTTLCEGNWKCRYCPRRITCSQGRVVKHCLTTLPESHAHKGRLSIQLSCQLHTRRLNETQALPAPLYSIFSRAFIEKLPPLWGENNSSSAKPIPFDTQSFQGHSPRIPILGWHHHDIRGESVHRYRHLHRGSSTRP